MDGWSASSAIMRDRNWEDKSYRLPFRASVEAVQSQAAIRIDFDVVRSLFKSFFLSLFHYFEGVMILFWKAFLTLCSLEPVEIEIRLSRGMAYAAQTFTGWHLFSFLMIYVQQIICCRSWLE